MSSYAQDGIRLKLYNSLTGPSVLHDYLEFLNNNYPAVQKSVKEAIRTSDPGNLKAAKVALSALTPDQTKLRASQVYDALNALKISLTENSELSLGSVRYEVDAFKDIYDEFNHSNKGDYGQRYELLMRAHALWNALAVSTEALDGAFEADPESEESDVDATLELYFPDVASLEEYAEKLGAIRDLVSELSELVPTRGDVVVRRLSAGSLWITLVGSAEFIDLIREVVLVGATYFITRLTKDGKVASNQKYTEALIRLIDVEGRAREAGIPTDRMRKSIESMGANLAESLESLLENQEEIEVNRDRVVLRPTVHKGLVTRDRKLLGDGKSST